MDLLEMVSPIGALGVQRLSPAAARALPASNVIPLRPAPGGPAAAPAAPAAAPPRVIDVSPAAAPAVAPAPEPAPQPATGDDLRAMNNFVRQQRDMERDRKAREVSELEAFMRGQKAPAPPPEDPPAAAPAPSSPAVRSSTREEQRRVDLGFFPFDHIVLPLAGALAVGGLITWAIMRKPSPPKKNPAPPSSARKG